jgi:hypothetical protein
MVKKLQSNATEKSRRLPVAGVYEGSKGKTVGAD